MIETDSFYSSYIMHAQKDGFVKKIYINKNLEDHIIERNILIRKGDKVKKFNGSNDTLGTFILKFDNRTEMIEKLDNMHDYIKVLF